MHRGIKIGFVLTLAVLGGNAAFAILSARALIETGDRMARTHSFLRLVELTVNRLKDAEAGQRCYLLTGDKTHLEPYRTAARQVPDDLSRLRELVRDHPNQAARLAGLCNSATDLLDEFGREIAQRPAGDATADRRMIHIDESRADAVAIRDAASEIQDVARQQLARGAEELDRNARRALLAFCLATGVALVALLWEFDAVRRQFLRQEQAARELGDQRERFRVTLASIEDGVIVTDTDGCVTFLNPVAEGLTGWGQDAVGRPVSEVFRVLNERTREAVGDSAVCAVRLGAAVALSGHTALISRDGVERPIENATAPIQDGTRAVVGAVLAFRDVTERRRAEEALRDQAALLDEATDAILVEDPSGRVIYWNRGSERLYGWTAGEAVGCEAAGLLDGGPSTAREEALAAATARGEWAGELRQHRRDGRTVTVASRWTLLRDATGRPRSRLVINADVTEKKKLEAQVLRAQRLESIGTLAGGIAHDLNNVLTPIIMGLEVLRTVQDEPERLSVLETIQSAARRGAELVKQVLLFSQRADAPCGGSSFVPPETKRSGETRKSALAASATGHGELILVVDDEAAIAQIARHTLEAHGYRVLTATNGAEAVEVFRRHRDDVMVVLTDMMMPVMDGPATIRAIRQLDADVPFIAASGLTDPTRSAGVTPDVAATLSKPFTAATLVTTVQSVLTKSGGRNGSSTP